MKNFLFFAFILFLLSSAMPYTKDDVLKLLNSPFHQRLFGNTYKSLLERLQPSGYLPESLTGAYGGEFPRTLGPYVFLLLESGEFEKARRVLQYVLDATSLAGMNRIPHVIGPEYREREPQVDDANPGQTLHFIPLYRLDLPDYGGAQPFKAVSSKLYAVEIWLTKEGETEGVLKVEIASQPEGKAIAGVEMPTSKIGTQGWVRVVFPKPLDLKPSA